MAKALKDEVLRILSRVQMPAQYLGGELNSVVKDHRFRSRQALHGLPDTYTLAPVTTACRCCTPS